MKNKKFLYHILVMICALCAVFGVACGDNKNEDGSSLVLETGVTFSAELNEIFYKPIVFDGYEYSITDNNGSAITLDRENYFCNKIGDYIITAKKNGNEQTFPLYVRDTQKPLFSRLSADVISRTVGESVVLGDFFDVTDNSGVVIMSYDIERNGLEKIAVGEDGVLDLQYGFYNVKAMAKDPSGNGAEKLLRILVKDDKEIKSFDLISSAAAYIEAPRFSYNYNEININNALSESDENNGFVWNLNTGVDAFCNQLIRIDVNEIFGGLSDTVDSIAFKIKLGNAFNVNPDKNWIEFYNYNRDIQGLNSTETIEGDWLPSEYGKLSYEPKAALISGMQSETEYAITLSRAENQSSTSYLIVRVRCSMGEDGTYNYMPTYIAESEAGALTSDYCISFYDFKALANVFNKDITEFGETETDSVHGTISWTAVAGATSYEIKIGTITNSWIDIGNVTSYDFSVLGGGTYRYAVRAVFASGSSAASVGTVHVVDPMIYEYKNAAVGLVNTQLYADGYVEHEDSVTFVEFAGKDAIRFDMMPDVVDNRNRRDMVIDLEEVYGSDLANISAISFKVYLGSAFNSVQNMNAIELCNWTKFTYNDGLTWVNADKPNEPYLVSHLITGNWVTVNIVRSSVNSGANSKYLDFCVSTLFYDNFDRSWIAKYNEEIAGGELTSDYAVYFADFTAAYSTSSTYTKMNSLNESDGELSWTAVAGATAYEIKVGDVKNGWTNIGNVLSYKGFDNAVNEQRVAVRAVFASGYSAASIIRYDMPSHTEQMMDGATGNVELSMYQGDYTVQDNMISLVTFDGKESIKLDLLPETNGNKRRAFAIDMQEIVGGDLSNIATISFKYNLGTAFKNGTSYVALGGWLDSAQFSELPYYTPNLFLIAGTSEDADCYYKNNSTWYEITLKPQASGNSRYVLFMIECTDNTWGATYNDEISGGELTSDYSVYFADFEITYS